MQITPLDIINKEFTLVRRGLDPDEVGAFLEEVRESMEDLLRENRALERSLKERERAVQDLRAREGEIHRTLMMAQKITEDLRGTARREADLIVGEARLDAQAILSAAHDEHRDLLQEVFRLRGLRAQLFTQLRATLEAQGRLLDDLEESAAQRDGSG